jgi:leucyl aminopeptidase
LCNGPARRLLLDEEFSQIGELVAEPFEISKIRREDYDTVISKDEYADVLQSLNLLSSNVPRGHQYPAAFLILSSSLDQVRFIKTNYFFS